MLHLTGRKKSSYLLLFLAVLLLSCIYRQRVLLVYDQGQELSRRNQLPTMNQNTDSRKGLETHLGSSHTIGSSKDNKSHCVTDQEIVENLRILVSDLIDLRVSLEGRPAEKIEEKYNKFQRMLIKIEEKWDYERPLSLKADKKTDVIFSCPEVRIGPKYNRKFKRMNCSKNPIHESITVIIDNAHLTKPRTTKVLNDIRKLEKSLKVFMIGEHDGNYTRPMMINNLIENITTPFVYVARRLHSWDSHLDLERLLDFISTNDDVVAVGNAIVNNLDGHWSHGCCQARLKNYTLVYERGYRQSKGSCIKCDVLEGPFLTRLEVLKMFPFSGSLADGYYEDWFLRINARNNGVKHHSSMKFSYTNMREKDMTWTWESVYNCPDVMSVVSRPADTLSIYKDLATAFDIERVLDPNGNEQWVDCRRGKEHRTPKCWIGRGMAVPPCCLEKLADGIKFVMRRCDMNRVSCELTEGTLLGAVKLQKLLPWERDADILFLSDHFEKLIALKSDFENEGYSFFIREWPQVGKNETKIGGSILILADGWNIEMYGSQSLDSHRKIVAGENPTKISFAGQMVNAPDNPGKVSRNRYGKEIYKHSEHWMNSRMNSGWDEYTPGVFNDCEKPGHHACLDQYEADGSLQFQARGTL